MGNPWKPDPNTAAPTEALASEEDDVVLNASENLELSFHAIPVGMFSSKIRPQSINPKPSSRHRFGSYHSIADCAPITEEDGANDEKASHQPSKKDDLETGSENSSDDQEKD